MGYRTLALAAALPMLLGAAVPATAGRDDWYGRYGGGGRAGLHDSHDRRHDLRHRVHDRDHDNWRRSRQSDWCLGFYWAPDRPGYRWDPGYGWDRGYGWRPGYYNAYRPGEGLCHCGRPFGHRHYPPGRAWGHFRAW